MVTKVYVVFVNISCTSRAAVVPRGSNVTPVVLFPSTLTSVRASLVVPVTRDAEINHLKTLELGFQVIHSCYPWYAVHAHAPPSELGVWGIIVKVKFLGSL